MVAKNDENVVRVISHGFGKIDDVNLRDLTPQPVEAEHSASLIRGVAAGIVKDGGKVGGFDCYTTSNVLRGSGLSSSAAFEVCIGAILRGEYNNNDMEKSTRSRSPNGQYAENVFFGKPCGLMDRPPAPSAALSPSTSRTRPTRWSARPPLTWRSTALSCASAIRRAATPT